MVYLDLLVVCHLQRSDKAVFLDGRTEVDAPFLLPYGLVRCRRLERLKAAEFTTVRYC